MVKPPLMSLQPTPEDVRGGMWLAGQLLSWDLPAQHLTCVQQPPRTRVETVLNTDPSRELGLEG